MVKDVLQDVKCSLIRVPFFFVQTILIIGMHNFFIRALAALSKDSGLVLSTHMVSHNYP